MTDLDPTSRQHQVDPEIIDRNYADNAANVRARFKVYELADPYVNINKKALDTLVNLGKLLTDSSVMDIGTADANLLELLRFMYGHLGPFVGMDPNVNQFPNPEHLRFTKEDWEGFVEPTEELSDDIDVPETIQVVKASPVHLADNASLVKGRAHELGAFDNDSMDVLFAMFMLYHVPDELREQAFHEFKRVLKPSGVFVEATSGVDNKPAHRDFEEALAVELGIKPPQHMNTGFTSEKAAIEIPTYFDHLYIFNQSARIIVNNRRKLSIYLQSIRSLRDQFDPVPAEAEFEEALIARILPIIINSMREQGHFKDEVRRSLGFGTNEPLNIPEEEGFIRVT